MITQRSVARQTQRTQGTSRGSASIRGFTLIEIMIVVLIIGVLVGIAYPSYQGHVIKTRRAAATACMLEAAQFMERFYTTNLKYNTNLAGTAVALPEAQCTRDLASHYTIGLATGTTATAYTIQAVPIGHQYAKDNAKCGTLTVNQTGAKTESGTGSVKDCW